MNVGEESCARDRNCLAERIRRSRGATQWKKRTRSGAVVPGALLYLAITVLFAAGCGDEYELPFNVEPLLQFLGLEDLPPANEGAFEGGPTGTSEDAALANALADEDDRRPDGEAVFNMPTNGPPSPLFGAEPFRQQMLRFEEFGREGFVPHENGKKKGQYKAFPAPQSIHSGPDGHKLDQFLEQNIHPLPTRRANDVDHNPWRAKIEWYLGRPLDTPPAEGRPPGEDWAHQRWDEFPPDVYVQTAMAGARKNGGLRDDKQGHRYRRGEFGKGGLYHNTVGVSGFEGTAKRIPIKFAPSMPEQVPNALWTFDGTLPPKLLMARYGEPILFRHYNALPIDVAANRGFGLHTITTHEHNGHNPAESDGFANAFFFPGQFYDYRWPMQLAGYDTINTDAQDRRAGMPDGDGGITKLPGDWRETMSTHWFHDHMLDFTAQNVYKGHAAMMNYYSSVDRGNEALDDGVNLRFPSGTALDWGNRDYDVNLVIADKAWDREGQLWFNPFNLNGFLGDMILTNWLYHPYFEVRARRYRFRILNGSVSRYFKLALVDGDGNSVPFYLIANDGNIMEHTVYVEDGVLPTQGIAERYDIVVDFSNFEHGDRLYFVNQLSHQEGQITDQIIPLTDIVSGAYDPVAVDTDGDDLPDEWRGGDPTVGKFLELRVKKYKGTDRSMDPAEYVEGKQKMIPLRRPTAEQIANADEAPWVIETDGGKGVGMDPRRVSAAPQLACDPNDGVCDDGAGTLEIWRLVNGGDWSHPVHIHFEEGIILSRSNQPPPEHEKWARKDLYRIGPQPDSGPVVEIALRFREFAGTFMEHCHNTQHEDHAMLLRWDIEHPGQTLVMPTPMPSWDGVEYVDTEALPTFRTGDGTGFGPPLEPMVLWADGLVIDSLDISVVGNLRDLTTGEIEPEGNDERARITIPLLQGTNNDDGVETEVYFFLSEVSDEALAEEFAIGHAGILELTPPPDASVGTATVEDGKWTFFGDLPNPIPATGSPAQDSNNTYTPIRKVEINGQTVYFNIAFVSWGPNAWERLRIDTHCTLPDFPANTNCRYQGKDLNTDLSGQ
ncbi:MAG: multicopper oxidase domain-containing protein, partial [Deltaproteobacteria bacterium]|nr:multicopper oxidase domain-containing protein [Deltaproteobacteria bacterium]